MLSIASARVSARFSGRALSVLTAALVGSVAQAQLGMSSLPNTNAPSEPPSAGTTSMDAASDMSGTIKISRVYFVSPKDGATVKPKAKLKFGVDGLEPGKAGTIEPGQGHFHVIVDGAPIARGQAIPVDEKHVHFLDGQKEGTVTLPKGEHTLTLQFGDGAHRSYGETMSQTIKVMVK